MDSEASDIEAELSDSVSAGGEEYIDDDDYTEDIDDQIVTAKSSRRTARRSVPKGVRTSKRIRDKELSVEVDEDYDEEEDVLSPSKKRHLHTRSMDKRQVAATASEKSDIGDIKGNDGEIEDGILEEEESLEKELNRGGGKEVEKSEESYYAQNDVGQKGEEEQDGESGGYEDNEPSISKESDELVSVVNGNGNEEDDEVEATKENTTDSTRSTTTRSKMLLDLLEDGGSKKKLTDEEIQLRRAENARKRKNLSEKRLEEEKQDTINKLLKKRAGKSRSHLPNDDEKNDGSSSFVKPRRPYNSEGMTRILRRYEEDLFCTF
ncbi:BAQ_1a_G0044700.mRNA.1.CDS.1 [Saccharomyces cerevisiae]|nr:BAQ_1a_G0044700.mRNA.1.CDS.1 [Saccharomyces cerevisiae]CAI4739111.1 BAM_G0044680.mRNA.1.CDS.1 [Saccharomyces cerevisiae]CAI7296462.1 BAM_G0044680.mRNA.1.CDS.1 [Saccharomyces cerevisiae]CAI7298373.1 BAQ_1a_G0044700.mRNA.1.CDS.1 [Saccharomyces cerevisiae]